MLAELSHWMVLWLVLVLCDVYWEKLMSVEVKGLADVVRSAKDAIRKASDAGARLNSSAMHLTSTLGVVEDMTKQLDDATAELQGAVAAMSNGGPPLDESPRSLQGSSVPGGSVSADGAIRQVDIQNSGRR